MNCLLHRNHELENFTCRDSPRGEMLFEWVSIRAWHQGVFEVKEDLCRSPEGAV
jgi:hypothetical protein